MKISFSTGLIALLFPLMANAQSEVKLIAPAGIKAAFEQLFPGYEMKTGRKVNATFGSGPATKKQISDGEAVDVPIVQEPYAEVLASGHLDANTATPLASITVGIAVKKGAPKPDVSTAEAVKRALLNAKTIVCPDPARAAAGVAVEKALKQLGVFEQIAGKTTRVQGGPFTTAAVGRGEAEIGLTFLSEMDDPNIDIAGPLPKDVSPPIGLVGFISAHTKDRAAAKSLLDYLSSPAASTAYRNARMQPAH